MATFEGTTGDEVETTLTIAASLLPPTGDAIADVDESITGSVRAGIASTTSGEDEFGAVEIGGAAAGNIGGGKESGGDDAGASKIGIDIIGEGRDELMAGGLGESGAGEGSSSAMTFGVDKAIAAGCNVSDGIDDERSRDGLDGAAGPMEENVGVELAGLVLVGLDVNEGGAGSEVEVGEGSAPAEEGETGNGAGLGIDVPAAAEAETGTIASVDQKDDLMRRSNGHKRKAGLTNTSSIQSQSFGNDSKNCRGR